MPRALLLSLLIAAALLGGSAAVGPLTTAQAECGPAGCGVPRCEADTSAPVRAGRARRVSLRCDNAVSARLLDAPEWISADAPEARWPGVSADVRVRADAPSTGELRFEVRGHEGTVTASLRLRVVPDTQNAAPICVGDRASQRSDGRTPVDFHLHPWCRDPDGDAFVMSGEGPGTHEAPQDVAAGDSSSNWRYRTRAVAGTERASVSAVDELGARSGPGHLEVSVGPDVDRLPECRTNPGGGYPPGAAQVIRTRAGQPRRFALICEDADGDALTPRLLRPPGHGLLAAFALGAPSTGYWGVQRWIDGTYVPTDGIGTDEFSFGADGDRGAGPTSRAAFVPVRDNHGGGCGYGPSVVTTGVPAVLEIVCTDDEGDALSVEVVDEPNHGRTGPTVATPAPYAQTTLRIPYVPDLGYTGYDCVRVRVSDGHGRTMRIDLDVDVTELRAPAPPIDLPPDVTVPDLPGWNGWPGSSGMPPAPGTWPNVSTWPGIGTRPAEGTTGGGAPAGNGTSSGDRAAGDEAAVRRALETTGRVLELKAPAGVRAWAPARLSRRALLRSGRAPGVLIVCTRRCSLGTSAALAVGRPARRSGRPRSARAQVAAGQPRLAWVSLDPRQRRALRRARTARADVRVSMKVGRGAQRTVRRAIRVGS